MEKLARTIFRSFIAITLATSLAPSMALAEEPVEDSEIETIQPEPEVESEANLEELPEESNLSSVQETENPTQPEEQPNAVVQNENKAKELTVKNAQKSARLVSGNLTVTFNSGIATVTGYVGNPTSVTIPAKIDGNTVTSIAKEAFKGCKSLTNVTIPATVQGVNRSAFEGCTNLKTVVFKETSDLGAIFERAFAGCTALTSINLPKDLGMIFDYAFDGCSSLKSISMLNKNSGIGEGSFRNCTKLASVELPTNCKTLPAYAFQNCSSLKNIALPNSLGQIGQAAFSGCSSLSALSLPLSLAFVGEHAFKGMANPSSIIVSSQKMLEMLSGNELYIDPESTKVSILENPPNLTTKFTISVSNGKATIKKYTGTAFDVVIPAKINGYPVKGIATYAFNSANVVSVVIPEGVTHIAPDAFTGASLSSITLPSTATNLERGSLSCVPLNCSIYVPNQEMYDYLTSKGIGHGIVDYEKANIVYPGVCVSKANSFAYKISGNEAILYDYNDWDTEKVVIPSSIDGYRVTEVPGRMFSGIRSVVVSEGITKLNDDAFEFCLLEEISLPSSLEYIGNNAFAYNSELKSIRIPANVKTIGRGAFAGCESIKSIVLPEGLTSIDESLFYGCTSLESATIPVSIKSINASAFEGCESLRSIDLPNGLENIGDGAFYGCASLRNIAIPNTVTSIEGAAFNKCSSLREVRLPATPNPFTGSSGTFTDCPALTYIEIPEGVEKLGRCAFENCKSLAVVDLPSSLKVIDGSTFRNCSSLVYVDIPEGVTEVGWNAFENCSSLALVTLPSTLKSIGYYAFRGLANPSSIIAVTNSQMNTLTGNSFAPYFNAESTTVKMQGEGHDLSLCKANVSPVVSYAGAKAKPSVVVSSEGATLTEGIDYVVAYLNNQQAGTASAIVRGVGEYFGSVTKTFEIEPVPLTDSMLSIPGKSLVFDKRIKMPVPTITVGSTKQAIYDYEITYWNASKSKEVAPTSAGTYYIKVSSKEYANTTGFAWKKFVIEPAAILEKRVQVDKTFPYSGKTISPSPRILFDFSDHSIELKQGTDFTVTYSGTRKNLGTYSLTIKGKGDYKGTFKKTFKITTAKLTSDMISIPYSSYTYNGAVRKPSATVKIGGTKQASSKYVVSYWNKKQTAKVSPKNVGTYWVKVLSKNGANTWGSAWKQFVINPKATTNLKLTKLNNGFKASWTKRTVQVSGYQIAYRQTGKTAWTTKNVTSYKTSSTSVKGLKDKTNYQVKIRTYKTVNGVKYYSAYTSAKTIKTS